MGSTRKGIGLQVDRATLDRASKLAARVSGAIGFDVSQADVLRKAIAAGLPLVEQEWKRGGGR